MSSETKSPNLRNTGIRVLGSLPWGSHLCQFYETKEDLLNILVPYFQAGLGNNEFCIWIVSEPLNAAEATNALRSTVPDFDRRLVRGQMETAVMPRHPSAEDAANELKEAGPDFEHHLATGAIEIIPYNEWYLNGDTFDPTLVLERWKEKLDQALAMGFSGLRAQGNEAWLTHGDWDDFLEYEKRLNEMLRGLRIIVMCTYPLSARTGAEIFDVARAHELAIAKRRGRWEVLETPKIKATKAELSSQKTNLERQVRERTNQLATITADLEAQAAERKFAEEALARHDAQVRLLLEIIPVGVISCDRHGVIEYFNRKTVELCGSTPVVGDQEGHFWNSLRFYHPDARAMSRSGLLTEVLQSGVPELNRELILERPDGARITVLANVAPRRDERGQPSGAVTCLIDVTELRKAEASLKAREQECRTIIENTPDFIQRYDRQMRTTFANPALTRALRVKPEALLGKEIDVALRESGREVTPEVLAKAHDMIPRIFETGEPAEMEYTWPMPQGQRSFFTRFFPEFDPHGAVSSVLAITRDITEVKATQSRLLALTENSPDIIGRVDREGRFLYINRVVEKITGIPVSDFLDKRIGEELRGCRDAEMRKEFLRVRDAISEVFAAGSSREIEVTLRLPGGERTLNVRLIPERDAANQITTVLGIGRDITAHQRAVKALRESEHRFREVTESIDEVFWLKDVAANQIVYVSPAYEKVWGRTCESLYQSHRAWLNAVIPEDFERVRNAAAKAIEKDYDLEYQIVRPDGSVRWIHDRAFQIRDSAGKVYRIAGVADDITAHRETEQQLRQSQKMEAIGQLAGGVAHDFNNLLAVIQMHSSLLLDSEEMNTAVKSSLQDIMGAAERAGQLTRQLLTFSRREIKQAREIDLAGVIESIVKLLRRIMGEDIALETRFALRLPTVLADPSMIEQIVMNLAVNARDAMPKGGRLSISLEPVEIGADRAVERPGVAPGPFVCLSVRDTGIGIPPENLSRIFEPFFTTKEVGKGTGLGLATVFGIVEQHRGWIEVESELNRGTTFRVFLPALESGTPSDIAKPVRPKLRGGDETILLVEDESSLRSIGRVVLEQHGYRVFEAANAVAALQVWEKERGSIDLLLTDLIMPGGTSGRELAEKLLADHPNLKVIYISGYSDEIVSQHLHLDPGRTFLQKPFGSEALLATVRRCLDEADVHG